MEPWSHFTVTFGRFAYTVTEGAELDAREIAAAAQQNHAFSDLWNEGNPEEGLRIYPVARFNTDTGQLETHDAEFLWWIQGSDCGQINNAGLFGDCGPAASLQDALRLAFGGGDQ